MRAKKPQTRQSPGGTVKMKKTIKTAPTAKSIRRQIKSKPNFISDKKGDIKAMNNIPAKVNSQTENNKIISSKVTASNQVSVELEVTKRTENLISPKRIANKVNKLQKPKPMNLTKPHKKITKQKLISKQQSSSEKTIRSKYCNKELKNLGINFNKEADNDRVGNVSLPERDDECKASICEIVKTKSRTTSSQPIYGVAAKKAPVVANINVGTVEKLAPIVRQQASKEITVRKRANSQEISTVATPQTDDIVANSESKRTPDDTSTNVIKKNECLGKKNLASTDTEAIRKKKKQISNDISSKKLNESKHLDEVLKNDEFEKIPKKELLKINKINAVQRKNSSLHESTKPKKITDIDENNITIRDSQKDSLKKPRPIKKDKKEIVKKRAIIEEVKKINTSPKASVKKVHKPKLVKDKVEKCKIFVKDIESLKEQPKDSAEIAGEPLEDQKIQEDIMSKIKDIEKSAPSVIKSIKSSESLNQEINKEDITTQKKQKTVCLKGKPKIKATPFAMIVKRKYVRKSNFKTLSKPAVLKDEIKDIPLILADDAKQIVESVQIENILVDTQIKLTKDIYDFNESGSSSETVAVIINEDSKPNPIYKREKTLSKDSRDLVVVTNLNEIKIEENLDEKKIVENISSTIKNDNMSSEITTDNLGNKEMTKHTKNESDNASITIDESKNIEKSENKKILNTKRLKKKKNIFTDNKFELMISTKNDEIIPSQSNVKQIPKQKTKTSLIKKTVKLNTPICTTDDEDTNVKQENEKSDYAEADDDEDDDESGCSTKTKAPRKRKPTISKSRRMKLLNLWNGPKRHRVASLNALAKVQCLYENESRTAQELGLLKTAQSPAKERTLSFSSEESNAEEEEDKANDSNNISTRLLRNGPGMRGIGKHWEMDETSSTGDQVSATESDTSYVQGRNERPKIKKKPLPKKVNKPKLKIPPKTAPKKKPVKHAKRSNSQCSDNTCDTGDDNDSTKSCLPQTKKKRDNTSIPAFDVNEVIVSKRMASLNASAMLAASYEVDRHLDRDSDETSSEEGSSDEETPPSSRKAKEVKNENDDGKDSKELVRPVSTSVVIVQDTDVTITGVYVNSSLGASQEAGYCKMQYRVQSSVTEERVLRAPSSTLPEQPPKSYTPLGALSSMRPPGAHETAQQQQQQQQQVQQQPPLSQHHHYTNPLNPMNHSHQPIQPQYIHHGSHPHSPYHHHMTSDQMSPRCSESRQPPRSSPYHQISPVVIVNQSSQQSPTSVGVNSGLNVGQNPSAFCSPLQHQSVAHHDNAGYYQPAGPLISPHILPQQIGKTVSQPLDSDSVQLHQPPPSSSAAESSDSDVLITGSDLAPRPQTFRYTTTAATASQSQDSVGGPGAYSRPTIHQMHCPTYPPSYYSPYTQHHPPQDMCYSPTYQPYFPTQKVYPTSSPYRRYVTTAGSYYQTAGPPPQPGDHLYDAPTPTPTQATPSAGSQLVPAGPSGLHNMDHHYSPYYSGYSSSGTVGGIGSLGTGSVGGAQCYSTRTIQPSYMDAPLPPYPGSCPCPMQSCPKNVHTGPLIGSNKTGKGPVQQSGHHHHLVASLDDIAQATTSIQQQSMLNINQNNDNLINKITCKEEIIEARTTSHDETTDQISSYHHSVNGLSPVLTDSINSNSNGSIVVGEHKEIQYEKVALAPLPNYSMNHKVMDPEMSISPARGSTGLPLPPTPVSAVQPTDTNVITTSIVRKARIGKTMARERQMKMMCHGPIALSNEKTNSNQLQHRQEHQILLIQNNNQQLQHHMESIFSNELQTEITPLQLKQEIFDIKMECVKKETENNIATNLDKSGKYKEIIEMVEKKENCQKIVKVEMDDHLGFVKPETKDNLCIDKNDNEIIEIKLEKHNTYDNCTINIDTTEPDIPASTVKRRKLLNTSPSDASSVSSQKKSQLDGYKSLIKRTEPKPYLLTPSKPRLLSDIMRNRSRANAKRKYQQSLRFKARLASHKRARQKQKLLSDKEKTISFNKNADKIFLIENKKSEKSKQMTEQSVEKGYGTDPENTVNSKSLECTKIIERRSKSETSANKSQIMSSDNKSITETKSQLNKSKLSSKGNKLKGNDRSGLTIDVPIEIDSTYELSNANNSDNFNSMIKKTSNDIVVSKHNALNNNSRSLKLSRRKSKSSIISKKLNQASSTVGSPPSTAKCKKSSAWDTNSNKKDLLKTIEKTNIDTKGTINNKIVLCNLMSSENSESSKKITVPPLSPSQNNVLINNNNNNNNTFINNNNNNNDNSNTNTKILHQYNYDPHHFEVYHPKVIKSIPVKRNRSRGTKFSNRKRHRVKTVREIEEVPIPRRSTTAPRWSNGWSWEGEPFQGKIFLNSDDPPVSRTCYSAMRHLEGDVIRPRDCVLLRAGNKRIELPYVAKVAHLWENPEDGEMMMSLLWYYRPEHTEQGRQQSDCIDEVFASRHKDHNSVACIEDKCYVLTFNEYCRYRRQLKCYEENIEEIPSIVPQMFLPNYEQIMTPYIPRRIDIPPNTSTELVMFCRRVYDFRLKRLSKNPS